MNTFLFKHISLLLSATTLTVVSSAFSTQAQTVNGTSTSQPSVTAANIEKSAPILVAPVNQSPTIQAVPGTTTTSANGFTNQPATAQSPQTTAQAQDQIAQTDIDPGRATRGGSSYIGVGGNIGLSGNGTALSRGNFAVLSKVGLTRNVSFRPAVIFGTDTVILAPLTYDFALGTNDPFETNVSFAPYLGAGASYATDSSRFGFLVTGGVDVPLSREFTATAGVNVSFQNRTEVGLLLGIGYTFTGF